MATQINVAGLTLNPKEVQNVNEFIIRSMLENPNYSSFFGKIQKVTMDEQIGLVTPRTVSGVLDANCARPVNAGPIATTTQKFWRPKKVGDTFFHCNNELNALFKPYFDKVNFYRELYDIQGSDMEVMLSGFMLNQMEQSLLRLAFLGDTTINPVPTATLYSVVAGGEATVANYSIIDGLWKQFIDIVAVTPTQRIQITENNNSTLVAQTTLAAGVAKNYLDAMYDASSPYLRGSQNQIIFMTHALFSNYAKDLRITDANVIGSGAYKDAIMPTLAYNGIPVVNIENPIGIRINTDLQKNTGQPNARYFPNRIAWTSLDNLGLGTLNEADFGNVQLDYNERARDLMLAYGYTLDVKIFDDSKLMVAY